MNKQKKLWLKITTIVGIILVLQIPLVWVNSVMDERETYHRQASSDIARSWSLEQKIIGPFLVVPYQLKYEEEVWDKNLEAYITRESSRYHKLLLIPKRNTFKSDVEVERRFRGIYNAPVYRSSIHASGELDLAPLEDIRNLPNLHKEYTPYLVVFVSDLRGVSEIPVLNYNQKTADFSEGSKMNTENPGLHADIDITGMEKIRYNFVLNIKGSNALNFYPVGKNNRVELESSWPHPKFSGMFLPDSHTILEDGFSVLWQLNSLSSNLQELITNCQAGNCERLLGSGFGVDFIEPVSTYSLADRAGKYATLFLLLTFAAFFLFEIFKTLSIHPLQYLMVGLSLSIFYLLLVAFSEHIKFELAYWISTGACIALIGTYTSYVLAGMARAALLTSALLLIYVLMFYILRSEDYAFLMGSILLFTVLSTIMMVTRKFDWYLLGDQFSKTPPKSADTKEI